jgi:methyl-accepting chemotaxis protein
MKMSIGTKLSLGFMVMMILAGTSGIASLVTMRRMAELTSVMTRESQQFLETSKIWEDLVRADNALVAAVTSQTEGTFATAHFRRSELEKALQAYLASNPAGTTEEQSSLNKASQSYNIIFNNYLSFAEGGSTQNLAGFVQDRGTALNNYLFAIAEQNRQAASRMNDAIAQIKTARSRLLTIMAIVTIAAALIATILALSLTRAVVNPIRKIVLSADKMSMGDLDSPIEVTSQDEIGELQASVERMRVSLKAVMERLKRPH